jgi:hypothetical protein
MFTLLVGILLVVGSAVGFGLALFGRRPVPQPAMTSLRAPLGVDLSETGPSSSGGGARPGDTLTAPVATDAATAGRDDGPATKQVGRLHRLLQREETAEHVDASDVTLSRWVRLRSGMLLALTVAGLAALLGVVLSVLVVGLVLLAT